MIQTMDEQKINNLQFLQCVEIITQNLNPNRFPLTKKYDEETLQKIIKRYVNLGGDPEYFISGSGAPGNCCIQ